MITVQCMTELGTTILPYEIVLDKARNFIIW